MLRLKYVGLKEIFNLRERLNYLGVIGYVSIFLVVKFIFLNEFGRIILSK